MLFGDLWSMKGAYIGVSSEDVCGKDVGVEKRPMSPMASIYVNSLVLF